jgi:flagellar basal-body rod modification protein FlgD
MDGVSAGDSIQFVGDSNSRIVVNPDPQNPVVSDPNAISDSQSFMRLMIEQLKNQDPMNPTDSGQFTQQLAAINSLEQLISINGLLEDSMASSRLGEAAMLIGSYVEGLDANNGSVTGYVERVEVIEGAATLKVGDRMLLLDQVLTVDDISPEDEALLSEQLEELGEAEQGGEES